MTPTPTSGAADLRTAAQAVVDRWDTPLWKDVPATAEYIGRLRAALAAGQATAAQAVVPTGFLHNVIALCTQRGYSPESIEAWSTDHKWIADLWRQAAQMLAAAPAQPATQQGAAYAALPESFLEIPDVQDESGINAYYSREVVLECIDAALASHGQALASKIEGLTAAQESLGVEFERVLHDNLFDLYEESPQTASHGQAPAGAAEEIDKALNVYAQAFAARVNGWTRQNGDDLPGARSALFAAIHAYARASTQPSPTAQADSVHEDAARWNAWASGMVEACNSDEQEPAFLVALDKAIGDAEPPITLELLNEWTDAAIKQGASHDR